MSAKSATLAKSLRTVSVLVCEVSRETFYLVAGVLAATLAGAALFFSVAADLIAAMPH